MDLADPDTEARVLKYFIAFDRLVEEHGLTSLLGPGGEHMADYRDRMKNRCKI
ncbi:TPA: hypothetical protein N0F65_007935, partial [Lagenidium giganteum]